MSKVWFITGAGRGIGAHIVRAALAKGDRVVATGRQLAQLDAAFEDCDRERLATVQLDVADAAQPARAVQAAVERFGRIDVLVNNAAYGQMGNFEEVPAADVELHGGQPLGIAAAEGVVQLCQRAAAGDDPVAPGQCRVDDVGADTAAGAGDEPDFTHDVLSR